MDIAEVARRSGVPASALRFYEARGLIESTGRHGLRRTFDAGVLDRLAVIGLGRTAGFSLDEIAAMLGRRGKPTIDRQALSARAEALDENIRRLIGLRKAVRHAAVCPAPSHLECPTFRRLMKESTRPAARKARKPRL
jgi:DNA-binding transcriptional MerR regulator